MSLQWTKYITRRGNRFQLSLPISSPNSTATNCDGRSEATMSKSPRGKHSERVYFSGNCVKASGRLILLFSLGL